MIPQTKFGMVFKDLDFSRSTSSQGTNPSCVFQGRISRVNPSSTGKRRGWRDPRRRGARLWGEAWLRFPSQRVRHHARPAAASRSYPEWRGLRRPALRAGFPGPERAPRAEARERRAGDLPPAPCARRSAPRSIYSSLPAAAGNSPSGAQPLELGKPSTDRLFS